MVCKHRFLKVKDEEVLEIDCSSCSGKADFKASKCKKHVNELKTEKTRTVCLKTNNYKKLYYNNGEKKYFPSFINYYFNYVTRNIVEKKDLNGHKVVISDEGVEKSYNLFPAELELSFGEINKLKTIFDEVIEKDLPDKFFEQKKYFKSFKLNNRLLDIIFRNTIGFGVLELFFKDSKIQDVFIDSPNTSNVHIVHEDYGECTTNVFVCDEELEKFASKLRLISGRPFDSSHPIINTSLDRLGIRVSGIMEPLTFSGVAFAFRKHRTSPFTLPSLVRSGFISVNGAALLSFLVDGQASILITGSRSSGKTSLMSALLLEIPRNLRFLIIEDTPEVPVKEMRENGFKIQHLRVKSSFLNNYELSAVNALRAALRLGESVLVIGEVRGEEARALFEAMRIGAAGNVVIGTIHGSTVYDTFDRIVNDLKVERTSFKAADIVVSTGFFRRKDSLVKNRWVMSISEVRKNWNVDPVSEGGFFEVANFTSNDKLCINNSEIIKRIAFEKGMTLKEVKENLRLRKKLIKILSENDVLSNLNSYTRIKDYYYALFNEMVQKNKKVDYTSIFKNLESFLKKC
jgi:type IV secretory pathway ATPase VirB11/archaellum biosynthesis ATPase